jgi:hypothetical protein
MLYLALAAAGGILVVELLLRIVSKSGASRSGVLAHRFRDAMLAMARQVELFSTTEAHPFLQYTRPRTTLSKGDQEYGFRGIRLSDVPKPEGMVRIAGLGGASTEAGYPELLAAYLNDASRATQYQVLDFAVDGWSSLHGMLNFILNVREFHPDIIVIQDELTSAVCSGYPCSCPGGIHDYTPPPFQDNPLDERMLRISWIYRACKVLLGRSGVGAFSTDGRELRHYRRQHRNNLYARGFGKRQSHSSHLALRERRRFGSESDARGQSDHSRDRTRARDRSGRSGKFLDRRASSERRERSNDGRAHREDDRQLALRRERTMTSMLLVALLVLTAIISYPELHGRIAGLEREPPGPEVQLRLAQSVGALAIALLVVLKREWFVIGASVSIAVMTWLGLIWLEFALRIFFKRIAPRFGASSVIRSWKSSLLQFSSRMGEMSWMDPRRIRFCSSPQLDGRRRPAADSVSAVSKSKIFRSPRA